jgi:hypothetical protein
VDGVAERPARLDVLGCQLTHRAGHCEQLGGDTFLITVDLVEAAFFINVAFMALFVLAAPGL